MAQPLGEAEWVNWGRPWAMVWQEVPAGRDEGYGQRGRRA
jgi:hypothetical protein